MKRTVFCAMAFVLLWSGSAAAQKVSTETLLELARARSPKLEQALRDVIHQIDQRLSAEVPYARAVQLMTATFVLTGLRVSEQNLSDLFRGVKVMHESSAFKLYEEKGRVEASQRLLFRQGWNRFGPPDAATEAALRAIRDLDRLERMADAVLTAHSWEEFLATP